MQSYASTGGTSAASAGEQDALDHALDGRDVQPGVRVGHEVAELLDVVDLGERLEVLELDVLEVVGGLLAERGAVDEEQDAAEPFRLEQPVDEPDAGDASCRCRSPSPPAARAGPRRWPLRRRGWRRAGSRAAAGSRSARSASSGLAAADVLLRGVRSGPRACTSPRAARDGWSGWRTSRNQMPLLVSSCRRNGRPLVAKQNGTVYSPHGPPAVLSRPRPEAAAVALGLLDRAGHVLAPRAWPRRRRPA